MWRCALIQLLLMPLPWPLRRRLLRAFLPFDLHPSSRIGWSIIAPRERLVMHAASHIGHLTLGRGMDSIILGPGARIGNLNWLYGIAAGDACLAHEPSRQPALIMGPDAVITRRHMVDCSNLVSLHDGAAVVGYRTQIITHGLSTSKALRQYTEPITIGRYAMVGTGCILLGGSRLPDYSVLGAGSMLRNAFSETHGLYSGVPAVRASSIPADSPFFARTDQRHS